MPTVRPVLLAIALLSLTPMPALAETGDLAEGEAVFKTRCAECHEARDDGSRIGPDLHGLWGRTSGTLEGYDYSPAMKAAGVVWDEVTLSDYLKNPRAYVPQTKMAFNGLKRPGELEDILVYLRSLSP